MKLNILINHKKIISQRISVVMLRCYQISKFGFCGILEMSTVLGTAIVIKYLYYRHPHSNQKRFSKNLDNHSFRFHPNQI